MATPHIPKKVRQLPWPYCRCCGLLYLNNDVTRRAIRAGCEKE